MNRELVDTRAITASYKRGFRTLGASAVAAGSGESMARAEATVNIFSTLSYLPVRDWLPADRQGWPAECSSLK